MSRPIVLVHFSGAHGEETDILHGVRSYADNHQLDWDINSAVELQRAWNLERLQRLSPNDVIIGRKITTKGAEYQPFDEMKKRGVKWVDWAADGAHSPADASVSFDAASIGRAAAEHLRQAGAQTFAIQGPPDPRMPQRRARHHAFRDAVESFGVPCQLLWERFTSIQEHRDELKEFIKTHPHPIGFFFYHDILADRFMNILSEEGIEVPKEAMVIGGSSSAVSALLQHPITSVRLPFIALGRAMAKQAHLLLSGARPEQILIPAAGVIVRSTTVAQNSHHDPVIKRIQSLVRQNKKPIPTVSELSDRYKMHRNILAQHFQKAFRQSPKQWLMEHAMQRASDMLAETEDSIDYVAQQCGFAHRSNFSQRFQTRFGISPAAYRDQFR